MGEVDHQISTKEVFRGGKTFLFAIYLGWDKDKVPFSKYLKTFPGTIGSFIKTENHIGSAVSKILMYSQELRLTFCYFYVRIKSLFKIVFRVIFKVEHPYIKDSFPWISK